jgi:cell division septation protein DedD
VSRPAIPRPSRASPPRAWGAQPITIRLALTGIAPACTFKVSPDSVVVKITSGSDRIWSSQDCPTSVKPADVIVRNGVPSYVNVVWSGRRSDESCGRGTPWANAGFYHAFAAVLGSTPTDVQFEVTRAPTAVITKTAKPKPSQSPTATPKSTSPKTTAPAKPHSSPTATVSGKGSKCGGDNAAGSC